MTIICEIKNNILYFLMSILQYYKDRE